MNWKLLKLSVLQERQKKLNHSLWNWWDKSAFVHWTGMHKKERDNAQDPDQRREANPIIQTKDQGKEANPTIQTKDQGKELNHQVPTKDQGKGRKCRKNLQEPRVQNPRDKPVEGPKGKDHRVRKGHRHPEKKPPLKLLILHTASRAFKSTKKNKSCLSEQQVADQPNRWRGKQDGVKSIQETPMPGHE